MAHPLWLGGGVTITYCDNKPASLLGGIHSVNVAYFIRFSFLIAGGKIFNQQELKATLTNIFI